MKELFKKLQPKKILNNTEIYITKYNGHVGNGETLEESIIDLIEEMSNEIEYLKYLS